MSNEFYYLIYNKNGMELTKTEFEKIIKMLGRKVND